MTKLSTVRPLHRLESKARQLAWKSVARRAVARPDLKPEKIGGTYGGWIVPTALIRPDWVCYCGGVGEDVTFDLGLIQRFGCPVFAFDPTPRAIAYAAKQSAMEPRFRFFPYGLWSSDTTLKFFSPKDPTHVSHSVVNLQGTETFFEAQCKTVPSLMVEFGHDHIDLMKIDIEGAEHEVIKSMISSGVRPGVLCLEIDQPVSPLKFLGTMRRISAAGYELLAADDWNFTFVHRQTAGARK